MVGGMLLAGGVFLILLGGIFHILPSLVGSSFGSLGQIFAAYGTAANFWETRSLYMIMIGIVILGAGIFLLAYGWHLKPKISKVVV